MTKDQKEKASLIIHDLYLYPDQSKRDNILRGTVWSISFAVGIFAQVLFVPKALDLRGLCGAYLIFALSLLLEFALESRRKLLGKIVHGIFVISLFIMFLASFVLTFVSVPETGTEKYELYLAFVHYLLFIPGWIVGVIIIVSLIIAFAEIDKMFFYDENENSNTQPTEEHQVENLVARHPDTLVRKN